MNREGVYAAIGNSGNVIYVNPKVFGRIDYIENEVLKLINNLF